MIVPLSLPFKMSLCLLLACACARADEPAVAAAERAAYAALPVCKLSADGQHLARQPCRTAPPARPMPRWPVTQLIQAMPRNAPPASLAVPDARAALAPSAPSPMPVNSCNLAGCYDASGTFHSNAAGTATVSPNGTLCHRDGAWLQCH